MDIQEIKKRFSVKLHPVLKGAYLIFLPLIVYFYIQASNDQLLGKAGFFACLLALMVVFYFTFKQFFQPLLNMRDEQVLYVYSRLCKSYCMRLRKEFEVMPISAIQANLGHQALKQRYNSPSANIFVKDNESGFKMYYVTYGQGNSYTTGFLFEYPKYLKQKSPHPSDLIRYLDKNYDKNLAQPMETDRLYYVFYNVKKMTSLTFYHYFSAFNDKERERIEKFAFDLFGFFSHMIVLVTKRVQ